MLDQRLYYLNHIPLMMTWAYFYNEFLPVRKSYRKDYVMLAAAILAAVLVLIQIYEIPGSEQDNAVFRMTVSAATIGVVVYLVKGAGLKATVFALFAKNAPTGIQKSIADSIRDISALTDNFFIFIGRILLFLFPFL